MNTYLTFMQKEIMETMRNKRLLVLACVFAGFAILGPLMGRYLVEFITMFVPTGELDFMEELMGGMLPQPTWVDGYANFYANLAQVGVITVMLLYMGAVLDEKRRGTAPMMLMKGLSHTTFVMSKFTVMSLTTLVVTLASAPIAHLYTYILFEEAGNFGEMMLGSVIFWVFLIFIIAMMIFFSTVAKKISSVAIYGFLAYFVLIIFDVVQHVREFLPYGLVTQATMVSMGNFNEHLLPNSLISLGATAVLLIASIHILKKKEL
ncbi:MAG: ABC transporter permease [Defluviitaleaceae bacterium]|nr:ABC transporter permease [Defluviitaleaceae bacterium]